LLGVLCFARDNPFEPIENISKFTQVKKQDKYFDRVDFSLPDSARVLKKVVVYYQNLDGSVTSKTVRIDRKVDWHKKLVLMYKDNLINHIVSKPTPARVEMSKKVESNLPEKGVKSFSYKGFISFEVSKNRLKILTKDKKIRDFMVDKPYKIVVDFRRDANFLTKTFKVKLPPFVSIVLGNHEKYYRAAIELDGQYLYDIKNIEGGYIITLR
jgi:hypothetical protein